MVRIATLDDDGLLTPGQVPALATLGATATGEALVEAVDAAAARAAIGMTAAGSAVATAADASAQRAALGLGTAAVAAAGDFATAAQGGLADTATQPGDLGNAAGLDVGTTAGTVAAGDDSRITGALAAASLDTAATALDANPASALRVQQDARLSSTYARITDAGDGSRFLPATGMLLSTGTPSLTTMYGGGSVYLPAWSFSGGTTGQSVAGTAGPLPAWCEAVKIEVTVTYTADASSYETVVRVHFSELQHGETTIANYVLGTPVRHAAPTANEVLTYALETYLPVSDPSSPIWIRVQREPGDAADTDASPLGVVSVKVTPLTAPPAPVEVQAASGYNSWPMVQAVGSSLVCAYSRGTLHTVNEDARATYSRTSADGGLTWGAEVAVANTASYGECATGKGLDSQGRMLLWVRRAPSAGGAYEHDLYRSTDGSSWTLLATPTLGTAPVQITDVFTVPTVGLMCLWFSGNYAADTSHAWGTLYSDDDGATWTQTTEESGLSLDAWPAEPAAFYMGDGKILALARTENTSTTTANAQWQMTSSDYGATWSRAQTNIGDVYTSTPTIVDNGDGTISTFYYQRGRGVLRRRTVDPDDVFSAPTLWPDSDAVAVGSADGSNAGNTNATTLGGTHYVAFYTGDDADTSVEVAIV